MYVTVFQCAEGLEIVNPFYVESGYRIGIYRFEVHASEVDGSPLFCDTVKFHPLNVVFCSIGVRYFFPYCYPHKVVLIFTVPSDDVYLWHMLFFSFSFPAFKYVSEIHIFASSSPTFIL